MKWQLLALWVLLGLVAISSAFAVVTVVVQQHHQNDALRSIMCHAEHVTRTSRFVTHDERRRAIRFYNDALSGAGLKPCDQ